MELDKDTLQKYIDQTKNKILFIEERIRDCQKDFNEYESQKKMHSFFLKKYEETYNELGK